MGEMVNGFGLGPASYRPSSGEVRELIRQAARSPWGTEFLTGGAPDAVAAMFQVHAFVVDAAREQLRAAAPAVPAASPLR